ncbi:TPA: hypothetical protein I8Y95_000598 [Legionella pneumophila]|uniref:hypothetical protein n=1 Tax=Legionella pneumophila TaxID=446 RepID=UPI001374D637|nr:hypothetical protein [Legionella pneumophila]HAT9326922.1 hypothetical protein [Legionella pneumophila subsp. pneumophila]MCK1858735.1 hypothetical protein [Legionella pneumophila]HAT1811122.1 hypothetical protein [Legionella pneumophila]HAT2028477.1 hypothetical protein [Legionella pneumophila]HAT8308140.1 hypothetical protein [Legionella pneumophila]
MSKNASVIYIFVKGNKGKFAYEITDNNFEILYQNRDDHVLNDKNEELSPIHSDVKAMIASLEYVKNHRGKNGIPENPVSFLFTTFENNFHIANKLKTADKCKAGMKEIDKIKVALARSLIDKDQVKVFWIPKNFENKMEDVEKLLLGDSSSGYTP